MSTTRRSTGCGILPRWADAHGYASIDDARVVASAKRCADPLDYERANYLEVLRTARGRSVVSGH